MESILNNVEKRLLNVLAKEERTASATYEYFSNCMMEHGMKGAKKFFMAESKSELDHYNEIAKFMNDLGCEVDMPSVDSIDMELEGLGEILEVADGQQATISELGVPDEPESMDEETQKEMEDAFEGTDMPDLEESLEEDLEDTLDTIEEEVDDMEKDDSSDVIDVPIDDIDTDDDNDEEL